MDIKDLNKELQNEYVDMHELVVKAKYYFLRLLQSATVSDDKKNIIRDNLIEISEKIKTQQNKNKFTKINNYNIEEYKKIERKFLRDIKKKLSGIIKDCRKANPTKIKYRRSEINENEIDNDLGNSEIYGTRALERDKIMNLNRFDEKIVQYEIEKRDNKEEKKNNKVDDELIKIKTENFLKRIDKIDAKNPDIYYKAVKVIENIISKNKKTNIMSIDQYKNIDSLENDELYIFYDNYYNIIINYQNESVLIKLDLSLIDTIIDNEVKFTNSVKSTTCIEENEIDAEIPISYRQKCTLNTFNEKMNKILDNLEIRTIYDNSIRLVKEKMNYENNKEIRDRERAKTEIELKLNEML